MAASPKRAPALGRGGGAGAASRAALPLVLTALIIVAWAQVSLWSLSPYARYLDHRALEELPFRLSTHYLALLGAFVLGWLLMSVAMMLPTSLPLVRIFQRMVARRADRGRLVALLIIGYLAVWTLVGLLAHLGDLGVHEAVHRLAWLERREWLVGAATLAFAGVVQLSPLKDACLTRCRSPLSFVAERWGRGAPARDAAVLGMRHGLFCVGCCWPLMLVMFAFACGNVGWMAGLGVVMAVEKNVAWGRRLTVPVGAALLIAAAAIAAAGAGQLPG